MKFPLEGLVMFVVIGIVLGRDAVIIAAVAVIIAAVAVLCLMFAAALTDVITAARRRLHCRRQSR